MILIAGVSVVVAYATWRSLNYARGPAINIFFPPDQTATSSKVINMYGRADRISRLSINGRDLTIDELGNFSEILVIFPGINVVTIGATDQFGRSISKEVRLYGEFENDMRDN